MAEDSASAERFCDPPPFSVEAQGHLLSFQPGGPERMAALLAMIDGAQERIKLAFYIFATDQSAARVRDALTAAARRGVDVRIILDGFGSVADHRFFAPTIEAGASYCRFMPRFTRRYLIRNHQKLVVADGKVAMLGGFNVEDSYFAPPHETGWSDLGFTVEGPVVERIETWFDALENWATDPRSQFRAIRHMAQHWDGGRPPVELLIGGPAMKLSNWARNVSDDLVEGSRLDMVMGYFSPPPQLQSRLHAIARHGEARFLFPARSDHRVPRLAARALYRKLLRARARIWEFTPCRLHTKLIVLDDAVYLGSANFDMRSLYLNLEIVLKIEDAALADRMREFVDWYLRASLEVTPQVQKARATLWNRLRWRVSWFLVAVLDYTVNRRLNLEDDGAETTA
ncbi:MAG TPA: phosphatidylserine/phosphatidylglycerophosphate/cardiolipin synthase family protein [Croceibacterium sp.]|nr:phosphatidylserine/phosphatidylglycerophosphate/cardiolipin synthase family protein [Croceibacterium sp.]